MDKKLETLMIDIGRSARDSSYGLAKTSNDKRNKAISDERLSSQILLKSPCLSTRSADPTLITILLNFPNLLVFISKLI